jgi:hypothetical protein
MQNLQGGDVLALTPQARGARPAVSFSQSCKASQQAREGAVHMCAAGKLAPRNRGVTLSKHHATDTLWDRRPSQV